MRILHIITGLDYGGAEKLLLDTCKELKKRNHEVFVIYLKTEGKMKNVFEEYKIPVFKYDIHNSTKLNVIYKIYKFIKYNKIDVVHTHCAHANFLGRTAAMLCNVRIVTTIHNTERWVAKKGLVYSFLRFYEKLLLVPRRSVAIAISKSVQEYTLKYEDLDINKIVIINNAIDVNNINLMSQEQIHDKFEKDFLICSTGRLAQQKGHIYLIKSIHNLINEKKINNLKCIIIGEGDEKEKLTTYIKTNNLEKNIMLLGSKENPYPYMKKSNLFVMPSLWEGFGIVVLEAFLLKIPVLSTDVDGLKEIVIDDFTGVTTKSNDWLELAEKIYKFYNKEYNTEKFITNAYELVINKYTIDNYVNNLEKVYISSGDKYEL